MEEGGSSEHDEQDLRRKSEEEEARQRKGKAKVEESDDVPVPVPAAPEPEIRSFIDNDHHYLKIIGQHAVGPSSVEGVTRELSRVRGKDVHNILGNQDGRLKMIYSASGATIGLFTDSPARFHRHAYLELLGTVDQVKIAELLITDAITENYAASSVPTAIMPLDICHKAMSMPFIKVVSLLGMDGTNLARIEAESGTWIELDTSVPPMDGEAWERTVSIYGSEQQVTNAMEMINAIVSEGPVFPANEEGLSMEEIGYNEEGGNDIHEAWEDEMEAYYEKHGWEKIREMDFEKGGSGVETAHEDSADTKNEEVEGKKSIKEGEQKEHGESGSGTQKIVEESEDKKPAKEDEQMECVESGSGTQKNVEESEDKKSDKEDEQMECVDTGSGAQKEC